MIIIPSNVMAAPSDPFFSNTVLLLKTVGVGGASNSAFRDDSANNFVPVRNGDVTQGGLSPYVPTGYWSNYFDGSGDSLSVPDNAALNFGTGDFQVSCWVFPTGLTNGIGNTIVAKGSGNFIFDLGPDQKVRVALYGSSVIATSTAAVSLHQWTHIAVSRVSGVLKIFINGIESASASDSSNYTSSTALHIGIDPAYPPQIFTGYIADLRIVKGAGVTSVALPTAPSTAISGTSLLTCQDNRFIDRSSNNFVLTRNGDVSVQRFSPFPISNTVTTHLAATGSVTFDGNGDYMTVPNSSVFSMGTGAFTAEFWMNPAAAPTGFAVTMISSYNGSDQGWEIQWRASPQAIRLGFGDSALIDREFLSSTYVGRWTHIAVSREANGDTRMFFDGVQQGATVNLAAYSLNSNSSTFNIGLLSWATGQFYTGFLSNVRVVKGSALYTSNFTPSTTPLTAVTGTSLLTCQDAVTVTDASTNNFTITRVGDAKASEVSPFKRSSSAFGGSAYFGGTTDIRLSPTAVVAPGTADFTVEGWAYFTGTSESNGIFQISDSAYFNGTNGIGLHCYGPGMTWYLYLNGAVVAGPTATMGQWYHVAVVRNSGTTRLYLNGNAVITAADTNNYTGTYMGLGAIYSNADNIYKLRGYLSNFRYVRGTAIYTGNFTPPSAPVGAVTGTSLLLNFDNAGAIDATAGSVSRTVGDAKTSTTVTLFGGSTMYFDGTGDYLSGQSDGNLFGFGLGDYTVEAWIRPASTGSSQIICGGSSGRFALRLGAGFQQSLNGLQVTVSQVGDNDNCSFTFTPNQWYHVAVVRQSGVVRFYINGNQQTTGNTGASNYNWPRETAYTVGAAITGSEIYSGYMTDVRVTRAARYTSNFTPPTTELPTR